MFGVCPRLQLAANLEYVNNVLHCSLVIEGVYDVATRHVHHLDKVIVEDAGVVGGILSLWQAHVTLHANYHRVCLVGIVERAHRFGPNLHFALLLCLEVAHQEIGYDERRHA